MGLLPALLFAALASSGCAGVGVGIGGGTGQGFGLGLSLAPRLLFRSPAPRGADVAPPPRIEDDTVPAPSKSP
ncbi:MAG: hypothetical protein EOO22_10430 [Comamonadaceae bacterium]|nr:MAG: hypothetical protein EOO22_10430 [Comamonadaceae bacterium]